MARLYLENRANIDNIDFVPEEVKREIRVEVSQAGSEVRITAVYTYEFEDFEFTQRYEFFRQRLCEDGCTRCVRCVNNSIYFCYQPFYYGTDIIEIDNTAGMYLTVFVVKQFPDLAREATYTAIIKQYEYDTTPGEERTIIFSNFNVNLGSINNSLLTACQLWIHRYGAIYDMTQVTSGELVSRTQRDRMYAIEVEVYSRGELEAGGRAMLRTDAAKLD
jgi:hypothetical protein